MRVHAVVDADDALPSAQEETPEMPSVRTQPSLYAPLALYRRFSSMSASASVTALTAIIMLELSKIPNSTRGTLVFVARTLAALMRDAIISTCCAWFITFCFSLGNIFSGEQAGQQFPAGFMTGVLMWTKVFNWLCVSACFAVRLQPQQCTTSSKLRAGLLFWWFKVGLESLRVVTLTLIVLLAIAIGSIQAFPSSRSEYWREKLVFFLSSILHHFDTTACSVASARLFHEETAHGRSRSQPSRPRSPYFKRFVRDIRGSILNLLSFQIAAVYAYATVKLNVSSTLHIAVFMTGSIALKIGMQEAAKHIIFKQKVHSVAIMAALVGTPTVLIHTHMSIVMLRAQNINTTISGTLSTAILEIIMRVAKALYIKRQICQEARHRLAVVVAEKSATKKAWGEPQKRLEATTSSCDEIQKKLEHDLLFVTWKTQLLHYYAAEVYVDMFAEYVAMGCSYAILVFFWNHPNFHLGYEANYQGDTQTLSHSLFKSSKVSSLILQVGIEVLVDYVACVLETMQGVNMQPLHAHNVYLTFFLVWAAVGNITIASHVFFRPSVPT